jgi:hypothetical protein
VASTRRWWAMLWFHGGRPSGGIGTLAAGDAVNADDADAVRAAGAARTDVQDQPRSALAECKVVGNAGPRCSSS